MASINKSPQKDNQRPIKTQWKPLKHTPKIHIINTSQKPGSPLRCSCVVTHCPARSSTWTHVPSRGGCSSSLVHLDPLLKKTVLSKLLDQICFISRTQKSVFFFLGQPSISTQHSAFHTSWSFGDMNGQEAPRRKKKKSREWRMLDVLLGMGGCREFKHIQTHGRQRNCFKKSPPRLKSDCSNRSSLHSSLEDVTPPPLLREQNKVHCSYLADFAPFLIFFSLSCAFLPRYLHILDGKCVLELAQWMHWRC